MQFRALALVVCSLLGVGVVAVALQFGLEAERANAAAPAAASAGQCEAVSTIGSTHTAGGGALVIPASLGSLAGDSERIVAGTVKSFRTCIDHAAGGVSTNVTVRVTEHVKSPDAVASPTDVTFNVPGGKFGQLALYVGTSPEFSIGEQVIVFLQPSGGELRLTAGYQGKFSIGADGTAAGGWGEAAFALSGMAWYPADIPVEYYVNAAEGIPAQLSAATVQTAWTNAFNTWQNDPGSDIAFSFQGSTTRDSGADQCGPAMPDGFNDLTWGIASGHGASVLAITYTCAMVVPGPDQLIDADIEFDADAAHFLNKWRTDGTGACNSGVIDLESVTLHESGHFIGLTHPTSNSCGANGGCPVLNASYQGVKRTLCQDDQDGVASLYPAAGGPTPPPVTPTNTPLPPTPTNTPPPVTPTNTPLPPTPTNTPLPATATNTPLPPTLTNTPLPPSATPTNTPTQVVQPTNTPTQVVQPTNTPTQVVPPTNTPTSVVQPTNTPTQGGPTNTPTGVAVTTDTPTQVSPPTNTPTQIAPTETPTAVPTETATPIVPGVTATPTSVAATDTPTETATLENTNTPTPTPSATRTPTQPPRRTPTPLVEESGDANCDGRVSSLDALAILQFAAGLLDHLPCEADGDVDADGRVNALDAALVLQRDAGMVERLRPA